MEIEELRRFYIYLINRGVIDYPFDIDSFDEYLLDDYMDEGFKY